MILRSVDRFCLTDTIDLARKKWCDDKHCGQRLSCFSERWPDNQCPTQHSFYKIFIGLRAGYNSTIYSCHNVLIHSLEGKSQTESLKKHCLSTLGLEEVTLDYAQRCSYT